MPLRILLAERSGSDAAIPKSQPRTRVLIFTMDEAVRIIVYALKAGARGFVLKSDAGEYMVATG